MIIEFLNYAVWTACILLVVASFFAKPLRVVKNVTSRGMLRILALVTMTGWTLMLGAAKTISLLFT